LEAWYCHKQSSQDIGVSIGPEPTEMVDRKG